MRYITFEATKVGGSTEDVHSPCNLQHLTNYTDAFHHITDINPLFPYNISSTLERVGYISIPMGFNNFGERHFSITLYLLSESDDVHFEKYKEQIKPLIREDKINSILN